MFNRPGAAANVRARDLRPTSSDFEVQVPVYKMVVLKKGTRPAFTVPVAPGGWDTDPALRLVRRVWARHFLSGRAAAEHIFASPGRQALLALPTRVVSSWLARLLRLTTCAPPLGVKWTGHLPRAGAASAASAIGVSPPLIQQLIGLSCVETAYKHYINAQWPSSPAARALFSLYVRRRLVRHLPPLWHTLLPLQL